MRPVPSEIIEGVRSILKSTIEPEVRSEHGKARLREVRAMLAQVDWDDAGFTLARRNERLRTSLAALEAWRLDDPLRSGIDVPALPTGNDQSFAAQQECYETLAAAAVVWVKAVSAWRAEHPDDHSVDEIFGVLAAAL